MTCREYLSARAQKAGWTKNCFVEWLSEPRAIDKYPAGWIRVIFMDSCTAQNETLEQLEALEKINAKVMELSRKSTHSCQPLDSSVTQNVKEVWRKECEAETLRFVENGDYSNWANGSGKLHNPGKHFFLQLASISLQKVKRMRDGNGVSYARKAMIRCGLALYTDGVGKCLNYLSHYKKLSLVILWISVVFCNIATQVS